MWEPCGSPPTGASLAISAVTGLITLAVESLGSYLRNKQEKRINDAVLAMQENNTAVQNTLQQYSNDFLMYGCYNVETGEGHPDSQFVASQANPAGRSFLRKLKVAALMRLSTPSVSILTCTCI